MVRLMLKLSRCHAGSLPAPGECVVRNLGIGTSKRPIEAILVFKDPGDWLLELQIMTDVIMGGTCPLLSLHSDTTSSALRGRRETT